MSEFDYKIRFWNPQKNYDKYGAEIIEAIKKVGADGRFVLGPELEKFEKEFANYIGVKYSVGVNNGTDALYISLRALGIKEGDEVITVSNTFIATIEAIIRCGATPILVDIDDTYCMDTELIEEKITEKTKAILPVHLSGAMANMDRVMEIAKRHNLVVIEDAAQAFGAKWDGNFVGAIGTTGCFSLYPAKILGGWGDGGMITTNDKDVFEKSLLLRDHYRFTQSGHYTGDMPEEIEVVGNTRLDDVQAAVGRIRLKYIDELLAKREENALLYNQLLEGLPIITPPKQDGRVWQDYVIRVPEKQKELAKYLDNGGVKIRGVGITPNHKIKGTGLEHWELPKNEKYVSEFIRLPMSAELEKEEIVYVCNKIKEFYENII